MAVCAFRTKSQSGSSFKGYGIIIFPPEHRQEVIKGSGINNITHFVSETEVSGNTFSFIINKAIAD
jgi:hypothetical protein